MSRAATKWAYSKQVLALGLKASELAILRAICWSADPRPGHYKVLDEDDLSRLTGYTGHQTFVNARQHLRKLNLISYEHENHAHDQRKSDAYGTSNAYVYHVHCGEEVG